MLTVADMMETDLVTLQPSNSLERATSLMLEHRIRHLPVVDNHQQLLGLVSYSDLLSHTHSAAQAADHKSSQQSHFTVESIMIKDVQCVSESMMLAEAGKSMQEHKIGCLPVTRDGALVGIITDSDFVALALNLMQQLDDVYTSI
jgi:CBS domain-containing membrane protein